MPPSKHSRRPGLRSDRGSASLEFITAGFLLLIPLVYLILAMAAIQAGALSVEGASRQAARVFVQAPNAAIGVARANTAVDFAFGDFGIAHSRARLTVSCRPNPGRCLTREGFVTVTVAASIPLPLVPSAVAAHTPLSVPVRATSTEQVSRFWGAG